MRTFWSPSSSSSEIESRSAGSRGAVYFVTCSDGLQPAETIRQTTASHPRAAGDGPCNRNGISENSRDPAGRSAGEEAGIVGPSVILTWQEYESRRAKARWD